MTKFIGIGIIETVNKERNAFYLLLIFIICFVVEKLQRNFVLHVATRNVFGRPQGRVKLTGITK